MNEIVVRTSPCITSDIVKHINAHLAKAARKHPKFCDELTNSWSAYHYYTRMKKCKAYSESNCNGETVLDEEVSEALYAIASEDWLHARSEIFDAIAVLLRMDAEIVGRIEEGILNG